MISITTHKIDTSYINAEEEEVYYRILPSEIHFFSAVSRSKCECTTHDSFQFEITVVCYTATINEITTTTTTKPLSH